MLPILPCFRTEPSGGSLLTYGVCILKYVLVYEHGTAPNYGNYFKPHLGVGLVV
jgi:hypothetical protein